ncbi:MAG: cation diffusion facilitator family transporter [Anaerolineae bacterium]
MNLERWGWYSIGVNLFLSGLNLAIAAASGSLAVAAEMVHNLVDLAASIAVLVGLKLSQRKSRVFPYGLYKVENVVAVAIALLIFFTGYEIAREALLSPAHAATVRPWMLAGVVLSAVIPLAYSHFQMRAGKEANSPALIAGAQEYRVHVFSSGLVLVALVGQLLGFALDRVAALVIVVLVLKTGWELLSDGMRVLLDASLDVETLQRVRDVIEAKPAVARVDWVTGRNAGRYRFIEAEVQLRVQDLERAHAITHQIEGEIREAVPHVDRVLIHAEPVIRTTVRYAVPLTDLRGSISPHFGEAPYFGLVTLRVEDGETVSQEVVANPHVEVPKAKGIRVAEWLIGQKVDVVLLREDLEGRGPQYVFGDAGVELHLVEAGNLEEALAQTRRQEG